MLKGTVTVVQWNEDGSFVLDEYCVNGVSPTEGIITRSVTGNINQLNEEAMWTCKLLHCLRGLSARVFMTSGVYVLEVGSDLRQIPIPSVFPYFVRKQKLYVPILRHFR